MRIATPEDVPYIETILNHPDVIERITNDQTVRPITGVERLLENGNFVLVEEDACFVAQRVGDFRYTIHTNILPIPSGHKKIKIAERALRLAFIEMPVVEMLTMVPQSNEAAGTFATWMGFRFRFERPHFWLKNEKWEKGFFYSMSLEDWIERGACRDTGHEFHNRLHKLTGRSDHIPDAMHDCYVGAAVQMIRAGHPERAAGVYNHWARFAGYEEVTLVSLDPLVFDIGSHRLKVVDGEFLLGD